MHLKRVAWLALLLLSTAVYSEVIELDNINADHCRQQLARSKDAYPVIFVYMKHCPFADQLRPIYETVADEMPSRTFYAFNFANHNDTLSFARTAQTCLGRMPLASPSIDVLLVDKEDKDSPTILGQLKSSLAHDKQGILNAIDVSAANANISITK